jgi:hypothetical protein
MSNELEKLAEKGKNAAAEQADQVRARSDSAKRYRTYLTDRTVMRTFRDVHGTRAVPFVVVAVLAAVGIGFATIGGAVNLGYLVIALVAAGVVLGYFVNRVFEQRAIRAGMVWIESLPFDFNREVYFKDISGQRMNTTITLELQFDASPADSDRQMFSDACAGAVEIADRRWKGNKLLLESPQLNSYFISRDDQQTSSYSNALVHRWLTRLVDRAVKPIHDRQPIARATAKIK